MTRAVSLILAVSASLAYSPIRPRFRPWRAEEALPWAGGRGSRRRTRPFREFCNYSSASSILRLLRVLRRAVAPLRPGSAHPLAGERVLPFPGRLCLIGVLHVEQQALAINIFPTFGSLVRLRRFILIFKASLGLEPPPHSLFLSFSSSLFLLFSFAPRFYSLVFFPLFPLSASLISSSLPDSRHFDQERISRAVPLAASHHLAASRSPRWLLLGFAQLKPPPESQPFWLIH